MQFSTSTIAAVAALMASHASCMPLELGARSQVCGATPAGSGSQTPMSSPTASTADACKELCLAASGCLSFVFGLPTGDTVPVCELFNVAAASVPAQTPNLESFDVACTGVPTTTPTSEHPVGTVSSTSSTGSSSKKTQTKRDTCGAAPTGPSTSAPSPLQSNTAITTSAACLALCQATNGCNSIEFGKPTVGGNPECLLFSIPASELPPPTTGQSFVAYDVGC